MISVPLSRTTQGQQPGQGNDGQRAGLGNRPVGKGCRRQEQTVHISQVAIDQLRCVAPWTVALTKPPVATLLPPEMASISENTHPVSEFCKSRGCPHGIS